MRAIHVLFAPSLLVLLAGCAGNAADPQEPLGASAEAVSVAPIKLPTVVTPPRIQLPTHYYPLVQTEGLITFDNVPSGTAINTAYQPDVTFSTVSAQGSTVYALADAAGVAPIACSTTFVSTPPFCQPSGNDVTLVLPPATFPQFSGQHGGVQATFASPKTWVAIVTLPSLGEESLGAVTNEPFIEAFDPSGNYLGETVYPYAYGNAQWGTWQQLVFTAPEGSTIGSVIFATQANSVSSAPVYAEFDNLSYFPAN